MKSHLFVLIALASLALAPSAKGDVWTYKITSTFDDINVKFELPMFEQDVVDQTVFDIATSSDGTITRLDLSGGSAGCNNGTVLVSPGPCWTYLATGGDSVNGFSPSFNGAGTFSSSGTTVTITGPPNSVPEPSAWSLLLIVLLGVGLVARRQTRRQVPGN